MKRYRIKLLTTRGGTGFEIQMIILAKSKEMAIFNFAEKLMISNCEVSGLYRDLLTETYDADIEVTEI